MADRNKGRAKAGPNNRRAEPAPSSKLLLPWASSEAYRAINSWTVRIIPVEGTTRRPPDQSTHPPDPEDHTGLKGETAQHGTVTADTTGTDTKAAQERRSSTQQCWQVSPGPQTLPVGPTVHIRTSQGSDGVSGQMPGQSNKCVSGLGQPSDSLQPAANNQTSSLQGEPAPPMVPVVKTDVLAAFRCQAEAITPGPSCAQYPLESAPGQSAKVLRTAQEELEPASGTGPAALLPVQDMRVTSTTQATSSGEHLMNIEGLLLCFSELQSGDSCQLLQGLVYQDASGCDAVCDISKISEELRRQPSRAMALVADVRLALEAAIASVYQGRKSDAESLDALLDKFNARFRKTLPQASSHSAVHGGPVTKAPQVSGADIAVKRPLASQPMQSPDHPGTTPTLEVSIGPSSVAPAQITAPELEPPRHPEKDFTETSADGKLPEGGSPGQLSEGMAHTALSAPEASGGQAQPPEDRSEAPAAQPKAHQPPEQMAGAVPPPQAGVGAPEHLQLPHPLQEPQQVSWPGTAPRTCGAAERLFLPSATQPGGPRSQEGSLLGPVAGEGEGKKQKARDSLAEDVKTVYEKRIGVKAGKGAAWLCQQLLGMERLTAAWPALTELLNSSSASALKKLPAPGAKRRTEEGATQASPNKKKKGGDSRGQGQQQTRAVPREPMLPPLRRPLSAVLRVLLALLLSMVDMGLRRSRPSEAEDLAQMVPLLDEASSLAAEDAGGSLPEGHAECARLAAGVLASQSFSIVSSCGLSLTNISVRVKERVFTNTSEVLSAVKSLASEVAEKGGEQLGLRRGKIRAAVETTSDLLCTAVASLVVRRSAGDPKAPKLATRMEEDEGKEADTSNLPRSIAANKEAYKQSEWQKEPFPPAPYETLDEFFINDKHEDKELLQWKMSTGLKGHCGPGCACTSQVTLGNFSTKLNRIESECPCFSKMTECDESCGCASAGACCFNRQITEKRALVPGTDMVEVPCWGMDRYTALNVRNAVIEDSDFRRLFQINHGCSPDGILVALPAPEKVAAPTAQCDSNADSSVQAAGKLPGAEIFNLGLAVDNGTLPAAEGIKSEATLGKELQAWAGRWLEQRLLPTVNEMGQDGWDIMQTLKKLSGRAVESGDKLGAAAAQAVKRRVDLVGAESYFRIHPKGDGVVVHREGGLPPLTFVSEYLGEVHSPARWHEIQEAVKTGGLPSFYNIALERPKGDEAGYDLLHIDAEFKGTIASRLSHSCSPNCHAVVVAAHGRLTVALYTTRHVQPGEELVFDYACVTESEREFREAVCLCSSANCRGSFLIFNGVDYVSPVLSERHTFAHRSGCFLRACLEPLETADHDRLNRHAIRASVLGRADRHDGVPTWLMKWISLVLEFCEAEQGLLPGILMQKGLYDNAEQVRAACASVLETRTHTLVVTIDKMKRCLQSAISAEIPPLQVVGTEDVVDFLWRGNRSVAMRLLRSAAPSLCPSSAAYMITRAGSRAQTHDMVLDMDATRKFPDFAKLASLVLQEVEPTDLAGARASLLQVEVCLRELSRSPAPVEYSSSEGSAGHVAAADLLHLIANTKTWFATRRDFFKPSVVAANPRRANLRYVWSLLGLWHKLKEGDITTILYAERRGVISLPDIESCYGVNRDRYLKERPALLDVLDVQPESSWRSAGQTLWSFRNDAKIFGSPMFDDVLRSGGRETGSSRGMPALVKHLRSAELPA